MFQLLRGKYGNTAEFANDLFTEPLLQEKGRIIANSLGPLHKEYTYDFAKHQEGQTGMMDLQAFKADSFHYKCVASILEDMTQPRWIELLSLAALCNDPSRALDPDSASMQADASLLNILFLFSVHLASARCWSQAYLTVLMPYMIAGVCHPNAERRDVMLLQMRDASSTILDLEDHVAANSGDAVAKSLLNDISTSEWQTTREALAMGEACNWNADDPAFLELKAYARALFAAPSTTKDVLESAFGWLKDSLRFTKAKVMTFMTKFLYILVCPYAQESGVSVLLPGQDDFMRVAQNIRLKKIKGNIFSPRSKDLDEEVLPTAGRVQKIRPAGFHANRDAASAMAFAQHLHQEGFYRIPPSWPGVLQKFSSMLISLCSKTGSRQAPPIRI